MFDSSYSKAEVANFKGSWSAREETDLPRERAAYCQNVQFQEGRALTRYGYAPVFLPADVVRSMFNWVYSDPTAGAKNFLLWFAASPSAKLRYSDLSSPGTGTDVYLQSGATTATFANAGSRLIVSQFNDGGLGQGHGRVLFFSGATLTADNLFARPMLTTEVTVSSSFGAGGNCTPGLHKFAFILESRSGFIGRYSPATNDSTLTVSPLSVTIAAPNKAGTITLTPASAWPTHASKVRLIATTAANLSRWFYVPGATATVTPGSGTAASLTFNISDSDLAIAANSAEANQFLITQTNASAAPFSPIAVFEAGNRIGYIVNDSAYGQCALFSNEDSPQALNAAYSLYYLPGQRQITAAFQLGGVIYLLGPNWTYSVQDSGGYPSNWPAARQVDQSIGTVSPLGVCVNVALGTAWVASKAGLFRFSGGRYDVLPISWRNAEYARINWAAGHTVQVVDDAVNKRVKMLVPVDGATTPGVIFTWDYTAGTDPDKVSFSYDYMGSGAVHTAIGIVQNDTSKLLEVWLGPGATTQNFRREKNASDTTPYRDDTNTGIQATYRTAPLIGPGRPRTSRFVGFTIRIRGNGSIAFTAKSLDNALTTSPDPITTSSAPGVEEDRAFELIAEDAKLEISNGGTVDAYFDVSSITTYYKPFTRQR